MSGSAKPHQSLRSRLHCRTDDYHAVDQIFAPMVSMVVTMPSVMPTEYYEGYDGVGEYFAPMLKAQEAMQRGGAVYRHIKLQVEDGYGFVIAHEHLSDLVVYVRSKRDQKSYDERMAAIGAAQAMPLRDATDADLKRMYDHVEAIQRGGAIYEEMRALVENGDGITIDNAKARDLVAYLDSL